MISLQLLISFDNAYTNYKLNITTIFKNEHI